MILIRATLFAVFAFMGTISLSAQNWFPPATALVVLQTEYDLLQIPSAPTAPTGNSLSTKEQLVELNAKSNGQCSNCMLHAVKEQFVFLTLLEIKHGSDTGAAVATVRAQMINSANNTAGLLTAIQQAYDYMVVKLSI